MFDYFDIDSTNALIFCTGCLKMKLHLIRHTMLNISHFLQQPSIINKSEFIETISMWSTVQFEIKWIKGMWLHLKMEWERNWIKQKVMVGNNRQKKVSHNRQQDYAKQEVVPFLRAINFSERDRCQLYCSTYTLHKIWWHKTTKLSLNIFRPISQNQRDWKQRRLYHNI